jgi:hypothetical protein
MAMMVMMMATMAITRENSAQRHRCLGTRYEPVLVRLAGARGRTVPADDADRGKKTGSDERGRYTIDLFSRGACRSALVPPAGRPLQSFGEPSMRLFSFFLFTVRIITGRQRHGLTSTHTQPPAQNHANTNEGARRRRGSGGAAAARGGRRRRGLRVGTRPPLIHGH